MRSNGMATVVNAGHDIDAAWMSSLPTTDSSADTSTPHERAAARTPSAIRSLKATTAVAPLWRTSSVTFQPPSNVGSTLLMTVWRVCRRSRAAMTSPRCSADQYDDGSFSLPSGSAVLDLTGAYPDEAGIEHWERTVSLERGDGVVATDRWKLRRPATVGLNLLLRDRPAVDAAAGTLRYDHAVITFEPRPARLLEQVALDDPVLAVNWDRNELWRATATYPDADAGSALTTVRRSG